MKLLKLFIPLIALVFAINLHAQTNFFGNISGTKYYNGILVKTEQGKQVLAIASPWRSHLSISERLEREHGKATKFLWVGEVEATTGRDGRTSITRVIETKGMIAVSGLGEKNLQKYLDANPDLKELFFKEAHYITYNGAGEHLDKSLVDLDRSKQELFADLDKLALISSELFKADPETYITAAKEAINIYETIIALDHSYYVVGWKKIFKPPLELMSNADKNINCLNIADLVIDFREFLLEKRDSKDYRLFMFSPGDKLEVPTQVILNDEEEAFAKTLNDKQRVIFENRVLTMNKTLKQISQELGVYPSTLLSWQNDMRRDYKNFLRTGKVPNKYLLIDKDILSDFADNILMRSDEKYIFKFRIASTEPRTATQLAGELKISPTAIYRKEAEVIEKLERYLKRADKAMVGSTEETFAKTLGDKQKIIFEQRITADKPKTLEQLAVTLDEPLETVIKWGKEISQNYDEYLKTDQAPKKYSLLDTKTLVDFANSELKTPQEEYILAFRIANNDPQTLERIAQVINMPPSTVAKTESVIIDRLDTYLNTVNEPLPNLETILASQILGQKEFYILFKTTLIENLLKSYQESKSSLDALRLLAVEKIMQLYVSYGNTPTGISPSAADLALRDEIAKMDRIEPDKDYSFVKELKNAVKDIEIDKLDLETKEAKELKEEYETKIDLKKIEVE